MAEPATNHEGQTMLFCGDTGWWRGTGGLTGLSQAEISETPVRFCRVSGTTVHVLPPGGHFWNFL